MSSTATSRRFECSEGNSNKFWEVTVNGSDVTVHFGRIGTNGLTQTKSFADDATATKFFSHHHFLGHARLRNHLDADLLQGPVVKGY